MSVPHKITNYLSRNFASYRHSKHPVAFTAMETAAADHVPGRKLAKTVVLKADDHLIMAVLPADHVINMLELKRKIGADKLALASEAEFSELFLPCEAGAMPPFGKLFGFPIYCDRPLARELEIEFNGGTHSDTIRMAFSEFDRLESPEILDFSDKFTGQHMARAA